MEKNLLSKNILSNVQENTPNGVLSFSSALYNIKQNIYTHITLNINTNYYNMY
jgi:hypothetical protein